MLVVCSPRGMTSELSLSKEPPCADCSNHSSCQQLSWALGAPRRRSCASPRSCLLHSSIRLLQRIHTVTHRGPPCAGYFRCSSCPQPTTKLTQQQEPTVPPYAGCFRLSSCPQPSTTITQQQAPTVPPCAGYFRLSSCPQLSTTLNLQRAPRVPPCVGSSRRSSWPQPSSMHPLQRSLRAPSCAGCSRCSNCRQLSSMHPLQRTPRVPPCVGCSRHSSCRQLSLHDLALCNRRAACSPAEAPVCRSSAGSSASGQGLHSLLRILERAGRCCTPLAWPQQKRQVVARWAALLHEAKQGAALELFRHLSSAQLRATLIQSPHWPWWRPHAPCLPWQAHAGGTLRQEVMYLPVPFPCQLQHGHTALWYSPSHYQTWPLLHAGHCAPANL